MSVKFTSISSGSSGNSIFIGTENTKILIDAGLSGKQIQNALSYIDVDINEIDGIFVTHEHIDHIKGVGVISRRFNIPVYATEKTWEYMSQSIGKVLEQNKCIISSENDFIIKDLCIKPYRIPHDAVEPVGYSVFTEKFKIAIATDIGHVTENIMENIKNSDILFLESNHDVSMLEAGSYPYQLKRRILGEKGHLSNETAGKLLSWAIGASRALEKVFLGHLSIQNNTPLIAYTTVISVLNDYGITKNDIQLFVAPRHNLSDIAVL